MTEEEKERLNDIIKVLYMCYEGRNTSTEEEFSRSQIDDILFNSQKELSALYMDF